MAALALTAAIAAISASGVVAQSSQEHAGHASAAPAGTAERTVPLYDNLGNHHREVSTQSPEAQAYFDQGLRLQYAFNHPEAIASYREALRRDQDCAMCWWGIALAAGPNINAPMDAESGLLAFEAVQRAEELAAGAPRLERDLIAALAARYAADPSSDRAPLDAAYATAMGELAARYPEDPDVLTLHAAALMNLQPWDYWDGEYSSRVPKGNTPTIVATLERAVELSPYNPGACHYFIHAVEAAFPERALECADRLAALMPGAGHIVHMPGHIYIRVGQYADAVRVNEHAVHADESYISDNSPSGLYPVTYYPHNYHFMWFAASMAGMADKAEYAARQVAPKVPAEVARQIYWIQTVNVLPQLTAITFGNWREALEAPAPAAELSVASAMHHYARGVALARLGEFDRAVIELDSIQAIEAAVEAATPEGDDSAVPALTLTAMASAMLRGTVELTAGRPEAAIEHFSAAAAIEDELLYSEPPLWYLPVRHSLGKAQLAAGRPVAAEATYRYDLERFRENGWGLAGLARALEAQGKTAEAAGVWERFHRVWDGSDPKIALMEF